ncbi:MAG: hypothetical protein JNJ50_28050 [Acidobacteria bacterium]|nr:hypothetical protein [Acidobacteriota bacterium]
MKRIFAKLALSQNAARALTRPRRRQRGTIMLLTAVLMTSMIGMLALSIDLGFTFSARGQLQNGIDAAALAGAAGLRATIESGGGSAPHQTGVVQQMAIQFASFNSVRRYTEPDPEAGLPSPNTINITNGDVELQTNGDLPRVKVVGRVPVPAVFAGVFGLSTFNISATATASLFPVDGGTGTLGQGTSIGGGCWRPLMLPDTFFDSAENVTVVSVAEDGSIRKPDQSGDYYRSRFAAGARSAYPFVDSVTGVGSWVTGLRDTQDQSEIGLRTIMGMPVTFKREVYRVADLGALPRVTFDQLSVDQLARFGYCGQVRVGDRIQVFDRTDFAAYDKLRSGLQNLKYFTLDNDAIDSSLLSIYHYVKSASYPGVNTHGAILPVLFFNPLELTRNEGATELVVTNFGLFFMQDIQNDGTIRGVFVREVIAGGTPINTANFANDSNFSFRKTWLPMSVQLLK